MVKNYAAILSLALVAGCGRYAGPAPFQGIVEFQERRIGFETPGRLRTLHVKRGDPVGAGAPLADLDDVLQRHVRDARAAELAGAQARAALLRAGARREDTRATQAQLDAARAAEDTARRSAEREAVLEQTGASPASVGDRSRMEARRATAEREALEQKLSALKDGARPQEIAAADAAVAAATAVLALEDERLARCRLVAPDAGRVLEVSIEPGEVVGAGVPVVVLADTAHPYVDVFVPQGDIGGIAIGDVAKVQVDALDAPLSGTVEDVGRRTEFTPRFLFSDRERPNLVLRVRVRIGDPAGKLHAGLPARVTVEKRP